MRGIIGILIGRIVKPRSFVIEFADCSNYRGKLQVKKEHGKYSWRVDCDVDAEEPWVEIPGYLGLTLKRYYDEKGENLRADGGDFDGR